MPDTTASDSLTATTIDGLVTDSISYEDLYARWERGNWSATNLDFTEDAREWQEEFTEFERQAAIWNYALFFWGEDAVATNLSPYIDAAPLAQQKYFLTTQQVDEARHAVFFNRLMHEVCGIGDGSLATGLNAIKPQLTPGYTKIFDRLRKMGDELRANSSGPQLAAAVTLYHLIIEATMAQPGQHMICSYLEKRDVLPAFRKGMENITVDEQRHIGFGVKLISDLAREDPHVADSVAQLLREVMPYLSQVLMPPDWDERYITCFGYSYEQIGDEAMLSLQTKLRAAGLPIDELAGPPIIPLGLSMQELSLRGRLLAQANIIGVRQGPSKRDPDTVALLFDTIGRQVNPDHKLTRPTTYQWEFTDADIPTWHLNVNNGSTVIEQGEVRRPNVRIRTSYQDWVDIVGRRLDPLRAIVTGRLRLRGSPLALAGLTKVFPR
jgi:ribonucleotide reductase beta subunit family protein with ferritin-like domain